MFQSHLLNFQSFPLRLSSFWKPAIITCGCPDFYLRYNPLSLTPYPHLLQRPYPYKPLMNGNLLYLDLCFEDMSILALMQYKLLLFILFYFFGFENKRFVCQLGYFYACQLLLCFCPICPLIFEFSLKQAKFSSEECSEKRKRAVVIMQWLSKSLLGCGPHHIHSSPFVRASHMTKPHVDGENGTLLQQMSL